MQPSYWASLGFLSGSMRLLPATGFSQDGAVVLVGGLALSKLLQAGHDEVHDHEEHQGGPRARAAHYRHIAPRPRAQRVHAFEVVCQPLEEPPARTCQR